MKKYVNVFCITLLLLCVVVQPYNAHASTFMYDGLWFDMPEKCAVFHESAHDRLIVVWLRNYYDTPVHVRMRTSGRVRFYNKGVNNVKWSWTYVTRGSDGVLTSSGQPASAGSYSQYQVKDGAFDVTKIKLVYLSDGWTVDGDNNGEIISYTLYAPTPTPSPTATPTPTPTPVPVVNIDVSDTGLKQAFGFVMDIFNVPFVIAGIEVTFLQIFMYTVLASLVIYLVFSPSKD